MLGLELGRQIRVRSRVILLVLGWGGLLLVALWFKCAPEHDSLLQGSSSRVRMPAFELKTASGAMFRSENLAGKWTVVHFWASWCKPCLAEIPVFIEFAQEWGGKPVRFVLISLDANWGDAQRVLGSSGLPAQIISLLDASRRVSEQFGSYQYPESYWLNPQGEVVLKWVGPQDWDHPRFKRLLSQTLLNN